MNRFVALIAGALALIAAPAAAQKVKPDIAEYKAIEAKNVISGKTKLNPAKAYIFIRSPQNRAQGAFVKTPDAAEIANYEAKWREELADEQKDYVGKLKRWEIEKKAGTARGDKPVEPTEANFAIEPIDLRMLIAFGPQFVFDKADGGEKSFSYLIEVEPGEYTYLGPLFVIPNAQIIGQCYCMGSVKFAAKAGEITSLGDFLSLGWADRKALELSTFERELLPDRPAKATDWSVPASLAAFPATQAPLRAAGKRNNFMRALVGRIPPVPGVLAYNRDVPVDLVGQAEAKAKADAEAAVAAQAEAEAMKAAAEKAMDAAGAVVPANPAPAQ